MQSPPFPRYLVRHLSLSWASPIQSIYPHLTSWRSILILSTHLRLSLPSVLLPSGFPTKTLYTPSPHPYPPHTQPISPFSILSPAQYWVSSTNHLAPRYAVSSIPPLPRSSWSQAVCICGCIYSPQLMILVCWFGIKKSSWWCLRCSKQPVWSIRWYTYIFFPFFLVSH